MAKAGVKQGAKTNTKIGRVVSPVESDEEGTEVASREMNRLKAMRDLGRKRKF